MDRRGMNRRARRRRPPKISKSARGKDAVVTRAGNDVAGGVPPAISVISQHPNAAGAQRNPVVAILQEIELYYEEVRSLNDRTITYMKGSGAACLALVTYA